MYSANGCVVTFKIPVKFDDSDGLREFAFELDTELLLELSLELSLELFLELDIEKYIGFRGVADPALLCVVYKLLV